MPLAPRFYLSIPIALIRQNYPNGLDGWIDEHAAMLGTKNRLVAHYRHSN